MQGSVNEKQGLLNIMNCPWIIFLLFLGEGFASTTFKRVRSIGIRWFRSTNKIVSEISDTYYYMFCHRHPDDLEIKFAGSRMSHTGHNINS